MNIKKYRTTKMKCKTAQNEVDGWKGKYNVYNNPNHSPVGLTQCPVLGLGSREGGKQVCEALWKNIKIGTN